MSEKEMGKIISDNMHKFMERRNLTQSDVAEYVGVTQAAVSSWYLGNKIPRMDKIDKMCELFGCSRTALMSEDGLSIWEDEERYKVMQRIFDSKEGKILFDAAENATPEQLLQAAGFIQALKNAK